FILHGVFGAISDEVYGHARTYLLICSAAIPGIALYCGVAAITGPREIQRRPCALPSLCMPSTCAGMPS
ncbi:hypothetical protein, partial [Eubacterium aggregans]